jgi:hypothetical protein
MSEIQLEISKESVLENKIEKNEILMDDKRTETNAVEEEQVILKMENKATTNFNEAKTDFNENEKLLKEVEMMHPRCKSKEGIISSKYR